MPGLNLFRGLNDGVYFHIENHHVVEKSSNLTAVMLLFYVWGHSCMEEHSVIQGNAK